MSAVKEKLVTYEEKLNALETQFREKSEALMVYGTAVVEDKAKIKVLQKEIKVLEKKRMALEDDITATHASIKGILAKADERAKNIVKKARIQEDVAEDRREEIIKQSAELDDRLEMVKEEVATANSKSIQVGKDIKRLAAMESALNTQKRTYEDKLDEVMEIQDKVNARETFLDLRDRNVISHESRIKSEQKVIDRQYNEIEQHRKELAVKSSQLQVDVLKINQDRAITEELIANLHMEEERITPLIEKNEAQLAEIKDGKEQIESEHRGIEREKKHVQYRELKVRKIIQDKEIDKALMEDKRNN